MRKACKIPSNVAIRDLLGREAFTEVVLEFLGNTCVGKTNEGTALGKG